jgi:hypothetical protein
MGTYRKRSLIIEAIRFDGCELVDDVPTPMFEGSFDVVPDWLTDARAKAEGETGAVYVDADGVLTVLAIVTLEGTVYASPGDFVIRGTAGEIYPCKPEIFAAIYDPIDAAAAAALAPLLPPPPPPDEDAPGVGRAELGDGGADA